MLRPCRHSASLARVCASLASGEGCQMNIQQGLIAAAVIGAVPAIAIGIVVVWISIVSH
jgi:hypothetical protein